MALNMEKQQSLSYWVARPLIVFGANLDARFARISLISFSGKAI
jgi:hypothetical protein